MNQRSHFRQITLKTGTLALALLAVGSGAARADVLANNLGSASLGTETAQGSDWLTGAFGTGASGYSLDSITLSLQNTTAPGTAVLDLYDDGGLQPGTFVGTLTAPASYSTASLTDTTFTASNLTLNANATYWAVLHASGGGFDWSYAADNVGQGVGFQTLYATSGDAGATWFPFTTFPFQFSVSATPLASTVPEPGAWAMLATGGASGIGLLIRRQTRLRRIGK